MFFEKKCTGKNAGATVILALAVCVPLAAQSDPLQGLDAFVAEAMRAFEVPGLAVAVVKDGEVALATGYGVRKLGEPAPVDSRTLFSIASNTKAFTAAALGILVDEGKIAWDDPVTQRMPGFRMYDPYVTREITIRHPGDNVTAPHSKVEGKLQAIPHTSVDNAGPAGAVNSSVTDMSRWVLTQLASGQIPQGEGKRLFSERVSREMWSAQTVRAVPNTPSGLEALRTNFSAYGLGWALNEFRGHKVVWHTGGGPGCPVSSSPAMRTRCASVWFKKYSWSGGVKIATGISAQWSENDLADDWPVCSRCDISQMRCARLTTIRKADFSGQMFEN